MELRNGKRLLALSRVKDVVSDFVCYEQLNDQASGLVNERLEGHIRQIPSSQDAEDFSWLIESGLIDKDISSPYFGQSDSGGYLIGSLDYKRADV